MLTAIFGGIELMVWPRGNEYLPLLECLDVAGFTSFTSFYVPGLLLVGVVILRVRG